MSRLLKFVLGVLIFCGLTPVWADMASIRVSTYPAVTVADARSTVTVTAEVRDAAGRIVPDGTQVVFSSTLGRFRDTVVNTYGGVARGILVAGGLPGTDHVTVTAAQYNASSTIEVEVLSDRSLLSSANEYIEVVSPGYLAMSLDTKILAAAEPNKGVHLRYREIEMDADDLQLDTQTSEVRARKARLKVGKRPAREFDELYLKLPARHGVGTTSYETQVYKIVPKWRAFGFEATKRERFGYVQVRGADIAPLNEVPSRDQFAFKEITEERSMISARKAVVFPHREVQFQRAELIVDGAKTLKFPLFQLNLNGGTPIITDQIVNVNDSRVEVNYPYYLSLKPGETSLLRFRTGETYGRSNFASGGTFLDFEHHWNRGDQMDGSLVVSGLARRDTDIRLNQSLRFDSRSSAFAQLETSAFNSLYGSVGFNRQMNGFQLNMNGNSSRSLRGLPFNTQQLGLTLEKDPIKVGKLPVLTYLGLTATSLSTSTDTFAQSQRAYGLQARNMLQPRKIDRLTTLNGSLTISELAGENTQKGLSIQSSTSISRRLGKSASAQLLYDYYQDPYSSALLGHHRLSLRGGYSASRLGLTMLGSRSLDADRLQYQMDLNYRLSGLWRLQYRYTFDRFFSDSYLDYSAMLTYRLGVRDIGLTWSRSTNRFGIQVLGASFN